MPDLKIDAPRLLTATSCILESTRVIEFCGQDGILASYVAVTIATDTGTFEVSFARLAFANADDRKAVLAAIASGGATRELVTLDSGKRLAYKVLPAPAAATA